MTAANVIPLPLTTWKPAKRTRVSAELYEQANPDVLPAMIEIARRFRDAGKSYVSSRLLWEWCRAELSLRRVGDGPNLNNNYMSWFVDRLIVEAPDVAHLIRRRARRR